MQFDHINMDCYITCACLNGMTGHSFCSVLTNGPVYTLITLRMIFKNINVKWSNFMII